MKEHKHAKRVRHNDETHEMTERIEAMHRKGVTQHKAADDLSREFGIDGDKAHAIVGAAYEYMGRLG